MTSSGTGSETFEAFHASARPGLLRLAHLLTGSPVLGEELVQDTLLAVHRNWSTIDDALAYAHRTLVNQVRSSQRRSIRERAFLARHIVEAVTGEPNVDQTWALIKRLKPEQRTVVLLRFYADYSLNQIADELNIPLGPAGLSHRERHRVEGQGLRTRPRLTASPTIEHALIEERSGRSADGHG